METILFQSITAEEFFSKLRIIIKEEVKLSTCKQPPYCMFLGVKYFALL